MHLIVLRSPEGRNNDYILSTTDRETEAKYFRASSHWHMFEPDLGPRETNYRSPLNSSLVDKNYIFSILFVGNWGQSYFFYFKIFILENYNIKILNCMELYITLS